MSFFFLVGEAKLARLIYRAWRYALIVKSLASRLLVLCLVAVITAVVAWIVADRTSGDVSSPEAADSPSARSGAWVESLTSVDPERTPSVEMSMEPEAEAPSFTSNLPLVVVDTKGRVPDEEFRDWLDSTLTIYVPGESGRARLGGQVDFSGRAGFRYRGRSSTSLWPKKQFAVETRDELGEDRDVSLLGMPAESDWILLGPYSDKSLIRNVLAYRWSNAIGRYAARTRLVELFLDFHDGPVEPSDYHGVYVFLEKLKVSPARVSLAPLDVSMNTEPEVTGGYLLRKDWGESELFWTDRGLELEFREPKAREITTEQSKWIADYVNRFERALFGDSFTDPAKGYASYIDIDSFVDHFLLVEMTKNGDAYYHSTYVHKDRGKKLGMGPIWDFNLSMGNFGRGELSSPVGWYWPVRTSTGTQDWYARLLRDPKFVERVQTRWATLRAGRLAQDQLIRDIDELAARLGEAQKRNFERWPVLGRRVRYNERGWRERTTYASEIEFLKEWLRRRLVWLDAAMKDLP
ncbi:MAG: CotH kinase family protein [Planctomycetota bacterium]